MEEVSRWGLDITECEQLGERLEQFWQEYAHLLKTKTRDTSDYGFHYLSGLLRMEAKRNKAQIG